MSLLQNYSSVKMIIDTIFIRTCVLDKNKNYFVCNNWTTFLAVLKCLVNIVLFLILLVFSETINRVYEAGVGSGITLVVLFLQILAIVFAFCLLQIVSLIFRNNYVKFLNALINFEEALKDQLKCSLTFCDTRAKTVFICVFIFWGLVYIGIMVLIMSIYQADFSKVDLYLYACMEYFYYTLIVIVMHICYLATVIRNRYEILIASLQNEFSAQSVSIVRLKIIVNLLERLFELQKCFGNCIRGQLIIIIFSDFAYMTVITFSCIQNIMQFWIRLQAYCFNFVAASVFLFKLFSLVAVFDQISNKVKSR